MSELLIKAIRDQTNQISPDFVYVIDIVSVRFGGRFTNQIRNELQRFRNLQMLTLNDCGIVSLQNFPYLPNLIRLDLIFNQITGEDLQHLKMLRHIQTLMLGANKIQKIQQLSQLQFMRNLLQLDLINNPVYRIAGYRDKVYEMFPSLIVLDTLDKSGKDAFNNVTMMETVHRIPQHLFSTQPDISHPAHHEQRLHLHRALSRLNSLQNMNNVTIKNTKIGRLKKLSNKDDKTQKLTTKNENVFPVGRIRRMMKNKDTIRINKTSAIFLSAALEYVTAQFLQLAGVEAKNERKQRITPLILRNCVQNDEQFAKMFRYTTFGTQAQ